MSNIVELKIKQNQEKGQHQIIIRGNTFKVLKHVFSPAIFSLSPQWTSNQLMTILTQQQNIVNKDFLELGCGCGFLIVQLLLNPNLNFHSIMATDIIQQAVINTQQNVKLYSNKINQDRLTTERLTLIQSDVFDSIQKNRKFDIIYWNFPYGQCKSFQKQNSKIERGAKDPQYKSLKKLLIQLRQRLKQDGRLYLNFSKTLGNFDLLLKICQQQKLKIKEVVRKDEQGTILLNQIWT